MSYKIYNKKAFLLPDSIRSMAAFHAKIFEDGKFMFRIHDCNDGIRFVNDLTKPEEVTEAWKKLNTLANSLWECAQFIQENYDSTI